MDLKNTPPKIQLDIDEIQVEGNNHIPEAQLRRAVEQEILRRFGKQGLPGLSLPQNSDSPRINLGTIDITAEPNSSPHDISRRIANELNVNGFNNSGNQTSPNRTGSKEK